MAAKKVNTKKLDRDGFIFPLAIGALALIFFSYYFLSMNSRKTVTLPTIKGVSDLDAVSKDLEAQNPDDFSVDLKQNSADIKGF